MSGEVKSVLVTGASGFIGRRLCERLKESGSKVIAVGRRSREGPWNRFIQCDLSTDVLPANALDEVSVVYHLASKAHDLEGASPDSDYDRVIVKGTAMLVEMARKSGVDSFILMSSVKAMGEGNSQGLLLEPIDENWPHAPQSPYGLAKFRAEQIVLQAGFSHVVVLRPTMVYGPGGKGNLPRMREAVRNRRFPPIPENGNKRSMIHLDDLIEFTLRSAQASRATGNTYILTSGKAVSTRELYDAVRASLCMNPLDWSVPLWCLKAAATGGSLLSTITGRRMPLDRETLEKLTGSAWYSAISAERDLGFTARISVLEWLRSLAED